MPSKTTPTYLPTKPPINPHRQLRETMRNKRRELTPRQQQDARLALPRVLLGLKTYRYGKRFAAYLSNDGEIDPSLIVQQCCNAGKICYLPAIQPQRKSQLYFVRYVPTDKLIPNQFGILEPKLSIRGIAKLSSLDIIFLPLVAFDRNGTRLGMGGGYYDRTLASLPRTNKPLLVGLAHSCQEVDVIKHSSWDIPLDVIATEKELITTK